MGSRDLSDRTVYIYTLCDPRDSIVRYIGYSKDPKGRLRGHIQDTNQCHRVHWIQKLISEGVRPTVEILEECLPGEDFKAKEIEWIAAYKAIGFDLVNGTDGGEGMLGAKTFLGRNHTPEAIAKNRAAHLGRKASPETRAKQSAAGVGKHRGLGYKHTPEARASMRASHTGLKHSAETIQKIRLAQTPETRAKSSAAMRGNQHTLGYKPTLETRAKQSSAGKGRKHAPHSPETCAKISASKKGKAPWNKGKKTGQIPWNKGKGKKNAR